MGSRSRLAEAALFSIVVLILLANLTATTAGLRLAGADDDAMARGLTDPTVAWVNRLHDFQIGRFYADARFWFGEHLLRVSSDTVHATIRVGMYLIAVLAAAWFAWEWRRSARMSFFVVVGGVGLLPVTVGYQVLLTSPTLWVGWAAVWAMGALSMQPSTISSRGGLVFAYGVALAVHEVNVVYIAWPFLLRFAVEGKQGLRAALRELALCSAVLVAYVAIFWRLRQVVQATGVTGAYEGATLSLNLREAVYALNIYTWSGFPTLASWLALPKEINGPLLVGPLAWLQRTIDWSTWLTSLSAVLMGVAAWCGMRRPEQSVSRSRSSEASLVVALLFAAFAPNLLLALTVKYQVWSHQRMWPYYYTSMSYLAWLVLLVGSVVGCLERIRQMRVQHLVRFGLAVMISVSAGGVLAANREAAALLRRHTFFHWNEYRQWLTTDKF